VSAESGKEKRGRINKCGLFFVIFELMLRAIIYVMLLSGFIPLLGQNQLDEEGRKTGHWKVEYPNGKLHYEADFVDGHPVGPMVRYYENGGLQARLLFEPDGTSSYALLYYKNGKIAAEGMYVNQVKDSVWTYYSEFDGSVRIREPYLEGKLEGVVRSYYPNGTVSEELEWKQNEKHGEWNQFYENGAPRLTGHFEEGKLEGPYEIYYADGTLKIKGTYVNDRSDGTWTFYDESGKEIYALDYVNGTPDDWEKYTEWIQDSLSKYLILSDPESIQLAE
jgi:antitoxin component YwqK of YwqJK toxin-antitoxin module